MHFFPTLSQMHVPPLPLLVLTSFPTPSHFTFTRPILHFGFLLHHHPLLLQLPHTSHSLVPFSHFMILLHHNHHHPLLLQLPHIHLPFPVPGASATATPASAWLPGPWTGMNAWSADVSTTPGEWTARSVCPSITTRPGAGPTARTPTSVKVSLFWFGAKMPKLWKSKM